MASIAYHATLAATMDYLSVTPGETVSLAALLRQRKLFIEMNEAIRGDVLLQDILNGASRPAAVGRSVPIAKVLELRRSDNVLIARASKDWAMMRLAHRPE